MAASAETSPGTAAAEVYGARLSALWALHKRDQVRGRWLGVSKLLMAAGVLLSAAVLVRSIAAVALLLIPILLFVVLAVFHEKLLAAQRRRARAIRFYERGLARLNGTWGSSSETGAGFLDASHPYARDLDIFGDNSLFQYICTAKTRSGEEELAGWLMHAAPLQEVRTRQDSVRELAAMLDVRESLWMAGEEVRKGVHPDVLARWGEGAPVLTTAATQVLATVLALLWLGSLIAWPLWGTPLPVSIVTLLNFAYAHHLYARWNASAEAIERASDDLKLLSEILSVLEQQRFQSERLKALHVAIRYAGAAPSGAIHRLARLADLIESRHSLFARPLDIVTFWSAHLIFAAERWQRVYGPAIRVWMRACGELEALASLAAFAYEHPAYAFPEFVADGTLFEADELAHPLLPGAAIGNRVVLSGARPLMILSGPNMAGKSTFMRSLGVNAVLAQCGAPVRAARLRMSPLRVAASICILDSLSGGISRFYAEIRRLKQIADLAENDPPVLFLLDELLSGTNSHDRLIGTEFVLRHLVEQRAIGIVSTHDLALARIAETMDGRAFNMHFEDRLEMDELIFDYKLKTGVVQTSNALQLMRAVGLGTPR